jgi:hypothetical protein
VSEPLFNSEELAVLQAQMDQAAATAKEIVRVVSSYHDGLLNEGFDPDSALALTIAFQGSILTTGQP